MKIKIERAGGARCADVVNPTMTLQVDPFGASIFFSPQTVNSNANFYAKRDETIY